MYFAALKANLAQHSEFTKSSMQIRPINFTWFSSLWLDWRAYSCEVRRKNCNLFNHYPGSCAKTEGEVLRCNFSRKKGHEPALFWIKSVLSLKVNKGKSTHLRNPQSIWRSCYFKPNRLNSCNINLAKNCNPSIHQPTIPEAANSDWGQNLRNFRQLHDRFTAITSLVIQTSSQGRQDPTFSQWWLPSISPRFQKHKTRQF